jgi:hypothetical protein
MNCCFCLFQITCRGGFINKVPNIIYRKKEALLVHLFMNTAAAITALFDKTPRRHNADNVKEINTIIAEYEVLLMQIEGLNVFYEKGISPFFDHVEELKAAIKKSNDNKASKKNKDDYFDNASVALKDSMQSLLLFYGDGKRTV